MATTSTTDFATTDMAAAKAAMPTPDICQHPAFRNKRTDTPADSAVAGVRSGSTTPDLAHSSGSVSASGAASDASVDSSKVVGGSHQMSSVKLPGYWSHERSAELKQLAQRNRNTSSEVQIDGNGVLIVSSLRSTQESAPKTESKPNSQSPPPCKVCEEDEKAAAAAKNANGKSKGLFKEEKKGGVLRKFLGRKA